MKASSKNGADDGERKEDATSLTAAFDAKTSFANERATERIEKGNESRKERK